MVCGCFPTLLFGFDAARVLATAGDSEWLLNPAAALCPCCACDPSATRAAAPTSDNRAC